MTGIDGVSFDEAWPNRVEVTAGGLDFPCLGRGELVRNKAASDREKDRADLELLRRAEQG
jgi:hypothetical protein